MRLVPLFVSFCLFFTFLSCKNTEKEKIARLVNEWQGKEIQFPSSLVFTNYNNDTCTGPVPRSTYKILIYVDALGCISCNLQLSQWKELIAYTDSLTGKAIPFLFFFQSKDESQIRALLKDAGFDRFVCIDKADSLYTLNRFPSNRAFHTFLLNERNQVVIIGNPVHNLLVKNLYFDLLARQKKPVATQPAQTTAEASPLVLDVGTVEKAKGKQAFVTLRNTGEHPLLVLDNSTTCGCIRAVYEKSPILPGTSRKIEIKITSPEKGFFRETLMLRCNTGALIKYTIQGEAI